MDTRPGSELSIPQLLYALEGKLDQLMTPATSFKAFRLREDEVNVITARTRAIWTSARYLQNCFVPANRLPPEVLGLIPLSLRSRRDLINATAVCRYWRNTLLSFPDLWCDIDYSGKRGTLREHMFQVFLERSRNAPLNVRLSSVRYLPDIAPHLARFSELGIHIVVPGQLSKIASHFSEPAPILRTLSISAAHQTLFDLSIPPRLFGGNFTPLTTLRLAGVSSLKLPQPFPRLTRLEFQTHSRVTLRAGAMLEALEQMPSLEFLHVKFCPGYHPFPSFTSPLHLVTLPKLREVELTPLEDPLVGPPALIPPLLSALILPSVEQITIGMLPPVGSSSFPGSFEEQLPNLTETELVDVYVGPLIFSVSFHGLRGSRLLFTTNRGPQHQFQREAFCGTPFLSVKAMVVKFDLKGIHNTDPEKYFFELLQTMERLERLEIRGQCARLLTLWTDGKYLMDRRFVCPSLQSLVVANKSDDSVSEPLAKLVTARRSRGIRLFEAVEVVSDG